jgi:hypothetical protein
MEDKLKIRIPLIFIPFLLISIFIGLFIGYKVYYQMYPATYQALSATPGVLVVYPSVDDSLEYTGKMKELVGKFKHEYGIEVVSPKFDPDSGKKNLPWFYEELVIVYAKLRTMPKEFLSSAKSPTVIYLMKPDDTSGGSGGLYGDRHVWLFLPSNFNYDAAAKGYEADIYKSVSSELGSTVLHEFAHSYAHANFELLLRFMEQTGWTFDGKAFSYTGERRKAFEGRDLNPHEDFAFAVAILGYDPSYLTEAQLKFFASFEPFNKWPTYVNWLKSFRPDLLEDFE